MAPKNRGFTPRPRSTKGLETKIPLKKSTAANFVILQQEALRTQEAAQSAQRNLLNAATIVLNERDIEEAELVRVDAATKDQPAQLVVIVKKRSKG